MHSKESVRHDQFLMHVNAGAAFLYYLLGSLTAPSVRCPIVCTMMMMVAVCLQPKWLMAANVSGGSYVRTGLPLL